MTHAQLTDAVRKSEQLADKPTDRREVYPVRPRPVPGTNGKRHA